MKKILFVLFGFLVVLSMPLNVKAKPTKNFTFKRWQITTSSSAQTEPIIHGDKVYFRLVESNIQSNIWAQDLKTKKEYPVVEKSGEELPVAANNQWLVHNDYNSDNPENWYDIYLYNLQTGEDIPIAIGPENQVAQDLWGNYLIYNTGFTWPDLYLYNIKTGEHKFIAHEAIRPRIWGETIVWIKSFGFGYATVESYNLKTGVITRVPSTTDNNQSWPDIYQDMIVWHGMNDRLGIFYKNIRTGEERKISDSGENPIIWGNFIAWIQADTTGPYNIYAYDIETGTSAKISDDGTTGSSSRAPYIDRNILVWMSGAVGNSDIYGAKLYSRMK